ncbi:GTPase [Aureococcus anophagefferens]|nr:GTPase [Aureococcus anophagefferens]
MDAYDRFPDAPLPLVEVTEDSSLRANPDTLKLLSTIEERLCVVALCGRYRSGKSSLLNWIRDPSNRGGFAVGHGVSRCTKGIWVWGRPTPVTLKDGTSAALLLLDTEGLGGLGVDGSYDATISATIFALAALLSSTVAYNSLGALDERAIADVGFVARLSASVRARPAARGDDADAEGGRRDLARHLPSFLWILRDFALGLVDEDGKAIDSDAYLERALAPRGNSSQDSTRQALLGYFLERSCATLPRPYDSEAALNGGEPSAPRPEFVAALDALRERLFSRAAPKTVDGVALRGATFAGVVGALCDAFANGALPTMTTAWADVARRELEDAARLGREAHARALDGADDDLARAHVRGCRACEDTLRRRCGDFLRSGEAEGFAAALDRARTACDAV